MDDVIFRYCLRDSVYTCANNNYGGEFVKILGYSVQQSCFYLVGYFVFDWDD